MLLFMTLSLAKTFVHQIAPTVRCLTVYVCQSMLVCIIVQLIVEDCVQSSYHVTSVVLQYPVLLADTSRP